MAINYFLGIPWHDTDVVIPEQIDGKTVTMLARGAFYNKTN